jgi:hypothetical protein
MVIFSHCDRTLLRRDFGATVREIVRTRSTPPLHYSRTPPTTPRVNIYPQILAHPLLSNLQTSGHKRGAGSVGWERCRGSRGNAGNLRESNTNRAVSFFSSLRTLLTAYRLLLAAYRLLPRRTTPWSATVLQVSLCCLHSRDPGENYGSVAPAFRRRHHLPKIWIPLTSKYLR